MADDMSKINHIADIPTNELTYRFWIESNARAEKEREWVIKDHSRLVVLAELTNHYAADGALSVAAAERKARTSEEYKTFVQEMGQVKSELILIRAKVSAIEYEMKMRINKSFQQRAEHGGGHLVT